MPEIGFAASAALAPRTGAGDAAAVIPVLLALRQRQRGRQSAAGYLASVAAGPAATLEALAAPGDRALRLWALEALASRNLTRSRRIALSIRQYSGTWNRVHADLAAMNDRDPGLAEVARADLLAWLQHGAATSYGKPSPDQAEEIAGLLAASKLSEHQRREIAFVVGIRMPAARS